MAEKNEKILASCLQMCPPCECSKREKDNLIHVLETDSSCGKSRNRKADPTRMVKSYCRSAAGQTLTNSDTLRPPSVLMKTVRYLLENVINDDRVSKSAAYDFINDRLRSVKQDGVIQRMSPTDWFEILPPIIRFYGYSAYWLSEEPTRNFDQKLNRNQLIDCLLLFITNYESNACKKYAEDYAEVEAVYLIVNTDTETINRAVLLNLPETVFQSTLRLILKWYEKNYIAVFRLILKLPPLPACLFIALYSSRVRKEAVQVMSYAYNSKNVLYPIGLLKTNLLFNSTDEVIDLCKTYGVVINAETDSVQFTKKLLGDDKITPKKLKLLDEKLASTSVSTILLQNRTKSS